MVERLAPLADDELLLVWLLGEAGAPLTADELVERTAAWRPLGAPRVASWCDDAAGRDIVMQLALLAGGVRVRARFALTPAGAALAARLRAAARHDAPWLRAVQGLAPATDDGLRGALHDVDPRELEDWLAFAHARGLLEARVREHATVWELTAAGRREAGRGVG